MATQKISALQTLLAIKAITFAPHLNESERLVGCALIERFNRTTGRCDPGGDRLARLLFLHSRTVIRATDRLEEVDLFHIDRHGERARCNSYDPQWERLLSLELAWRERFASPHGADPTFVTPTTCHPCHSQRDSYVLQTGSSNLQNQTYSLGLGNKETRSPSFSEAAREQAKKRLDEDLRSQLTADAYAEVIDEAEDQIWTDAIEAEVHRRGAGASIVIARLDLSTGLNRPRRGSNASS